MGAVQMQRGEIRGRQRTAVGEEDTRHFSSVLLEARQVFQLLLPVLRSIDHFSTIELVCGRGSHPRGGGGDGGGGGVAGKVSRKEGRQTGEGSLHGLRRAGDCGVERGGCLRREEERTDEEGQRREGDGDEEEGAEGEWSNDGCWHSLGGTEQWEEQTRGRDAVI